MLSILILAWINSALAIRGEYASSDKALSASCKISFEYKSQGKVLKGLCSASLISPKVLISADHCRLDIQSAMVSYQEDHLSPPVAECGGEQITLKKTTRLLDGGITDYQDIFFVELEKPSIHTPFQIPDSNLHQSLLKMPEACYINGYGYDNEKKYGVLKAARVEGLSTQLSLFGSSSVFKIQGQNQPDHGDSGGGVYCEHESRPYLMGVIHGATKGALSTEAETLVPLERWLRVIQVSDGIHEEYMASSQSLIDMCERLQSCFQKYGSVYEVSHNVNQVIQALVEQTQIKTGISPQNSQQIEEFQKLRAQFYEFWEKFGCSSL